MVDKMRRRVIALERGQDLRDERRGGYSFAMTRFRLLVSEALHSIRANLSTTVAAIDDRVHRHVPARHLHRARSWDGLLEQPHQEGDRRQRVLLRQDTCDNGPAYQQAEGANARADQPDQCAGP